MKQLSEEDVVGVSAAGINDRAGTAMVVNGIVGGLLGALAGPFGVAFGAVIGSGIGTAIFAGRNPDYLDEAKAEEAGQ